MIYADTSFLVAARVRRDTWSKSSIQSGSWFSIRTPNDVCCWQKPRRSFTVSRQTFDLITSLILRRIGGMYCGRPTKPAPLLALTYHVMRPTCCT